MLNAMIGDAWSKKGQGCVRWAVNVNEWTPTESEWNKAIKAIQVEERSRIRRFRYCLDAKASLVGRLLMRFWAVKTFQASNDTLLFQRTDRGKPQLLLESAKYWKFNLSHAGKYTVFVAQKNVESLGVDVMRLHDPRFSKDSGSGNAPNSEKLSEFFRLMSRQFTPEEWQQIKNPDQTLAEQESNFFRFWTLKESLVKGLGTGLGLELQRLSFRLNSSKLGIHELCCDSELCIDRVEREDWHFEETLLDSEHCVCTAFTAPKIE